MTDDPVIQSQRGQIAAIDREILDAVNRRIRLVRHLKAHKASRGIPFQDPAQEERLLQALCRANHGPLSEQGLREIFGTILAWAKRDAERDG